MNPQIVYRDGSWWLDWDSDPDAIAYDIYLPDSGKHVQAGKGAPTRGVRLGPKPTLMPQIASAHANAYEIATDPASGWKTIIDTDFGDGPLPFPWVAYNFANSNPAAGWYLPTHAVVQDGCLKLIQGYDQSGPARNQFYGPTGAGWYQGAVYARGMAVIDHRTTVRMRVVSSGVGSHRNLPLFWGNSADYNYKRDGEEDYFETDPSWTTPDALGREQARTFYHYSTDGNNWLFLDEPNAYRRIDLSQWHTFRFQRLNHKVSWFLDALAVPLWEHQLDNVVLMDRPKHAVFQQENPNYKPPAGTTGSEEIQIDWVTVEVPV